MILKKMLSFLNKPIIVEEQIAIPLTKEIKFKKYKLIVKFDFVLDKYQSQFKLYDKFLPFFCKDFNGFIIDIGANVGDTSIAIFDQNDVVNICGVEADEDFSSECRENISLNNLEDRYTLVEKILCSDNGNFIMKKADSNSTASIVLSIEKDNTKNTINYKELMNLIPDLYKNNIDLLKIDIDGYDWDVLDSFYQYYLEFFLAPRFIYFEMQTHNNFEINNNKDLINQNEIKLKYIESLKKLKEIGFDHYCIFDNFGTHIKICNTIDEILELNDYLVRSQVHNGHSTIYYLDILVFKEADINSVKEKLVLYYQTTTNE
jgi:FkbM family methyltransferase